MTFRKCYLPVIGTLYVQAAAADANSLLLQPPLLVWLTTNKPQYSEGAVDWTTLAFTSLTKLRVAHFSILLADNVGNVLRQPSCVIVALIDCAANSWWGGCWWNRSWVSKALCEAAFCMCRQHVPHSCASIFIGHIDREDQTAHLCSWLCKLINIAFVVGSYSRAVSWACSDVWDRYCLNVRGGRKNHEEQGRQAGVLHDTWKGLLTEVVALRCCIWSDCYKRSRDRSFIPVVCVSEFAWIAQCVGSFHICIYVRELQSPPTRAKGVHVP